MRDFFAVQRGAWPGWPNGKYATDAKARHSKAKAKD